ncbi:MAG: TRAP transporter substrate-binding protein [Lawsonibacter sp.]|nr:TRAP transporter substrate-binding protein [Lawsonibacter sp.]
MKKIVSALLAGAMMLSLASCGGGGAASNPNAGTSNPNAGTSQPSTGGSSANDSIDPITLTIYSPGNENAVPTKTIVEYARLVSEASNGAITLDVHHSGELGNDAEAIESTRMGTIDLIFAGTSGFTAFYEPAKVLDLPFLFDSAEQAYEVTNSEIGEQIFASFGDFGLVYLSEGDNGMRHISTTTKPIHSASDVAGLKIRVPTSQLYLDVWEALGATPVALALNELALALSNGTAEAQDNATYHLVANATYDSIKYFSNINYMWMGCTMAANANTWNKLDPAVQAILKEQAKVAAKYSFDTIASDNESATKTLQDAGIEFDFEPDIQSFKDALGGDSYYDRYKNEVWYDQALLDSILAAVR